MTTRRLDSRMVSILVLVVALTAGLGLWLYNAQEVTPVSASADGVLIVMKVDGIKGESKDSNHKDWMDLESFGQAIQSTDVPSRNPKSVFEDMLVTKELDKASPKLAEMAATGAVTPKVDIDFMASFGGYRQVFYAYELKNVQVSSYSIGGHGLPTEQITLNFEEIKVTYTERDESGNEKYTVEYSWKE